MSSASRSKKTCSVGSAGGSGESSWSSTKVTRPGCAATSICSAGVEACTHLCTQDARPRM
eukprot:scaffold30568_cov36-Tisochrysis_lutea.AAC.2